MKGCSGGADAEKLVIYQRLYKWAFNWPGQTGSAVVVAGAPGSRDSKMQLRRWSRQI